MVLRFPDKSQGAVKRQHLLDSLSSAVNEYNSYGYVPELEKYLNDIKATVKHFVPDERAKVEGLVQTKKDEKTQPKSEVGKATGVRG